jgi:hypothetical protein
LLTTPCFSVVFVHGIGGDLTTTWKNEDTGEMWPRHLLPQKRPNTRVLSFGYNAHIFNAKSHARIRDHARTLIQRLMSLRMENPHRALILVGHCLGGLIIKQVSSCHSGKMFLAEKK